MHIDFQSENAIQSVTEMNSKCQNGTLGFSLEELAIINVLKNNPTATQKRIYPSIVKICGWKAFSS